jgi:predicted glycogen debranching enzyme
MLRAAGIRDAERARRAQSPTPIHRAVDAYLVRRGHGLSIVAGYPWFTDWGRDTFISLRGLCLATGRLEEARDILLEWAGAVSDGMLPNRFADSGETPEFNAVDASLWFVIAVYDLLDLARRREDVLGASGHDRLQDAVQQILAGYAAGTRS